MIVGRIVAAIFAAAAILTSAAPASAAPLCNAFSYQAANYTICRIDLRRTKVQLFWGDAHGSALGSLDALAADRKGRGERLLIAMNAGMYDPDLRPVGLYVEGGREIKAANTADGPGNFHLKPNGVFYLAGSTAGVSDTGAFLRSKLKPDYATQSGPMLVIDGRVHPRFGGYQRSMKIRNGVGIAPDGAVVLVISRDPVTFPQFAALFRDALKCRDALYLDGSVSSLRIEGEAGPSSLDQGGFRRLGPMIGVIAR